MWFSAGGDGIMGEGIHFVKWSFYTYYVLLFNAGYDKLCGILFDISKEKWAKNDKILI